MDLPCVQWQDHVAKKWTGLEPVSKERFSSLSEVDDVFRDALTLTTQEDLDFLRSISESRSVQKSAGRAAECRESGNHRFKSKDYATAALHYSQGVCSAPPGSEQLSLCYANRSAALYHLQLYQECLGDMEAALRSGYPSHLHHKLEERRALCLKHLSKNRRGGSSLSPPPSSARSGAPCPGAKVSSSAEKGRHLVAERRIAAGEVIFSDRPYSCVLIPSIKEEKGEGEVQGEWGGFGTQHRRCHRCLAETPRPVPCDGCSSSRYCSMGCRQGAWREHHRWECALGAELAAMGVVAQLALRVAFKAGWKNVRAARGPITSERAGSYPVEVDPSASRHGDSYLGVFHLLHHLDRHSPALRFLNAVTVATLYLTLSKAGPPPASWDLGGASAANGQTAAEAGEGAEWGAEMWMMGSAALRHLLQLRCNAQAIMALQDTGAAGAAVLSRREIRVATAIFPTLSLLNHSCRPNTGLTFSTGAAAAAAVDACGADASAEDEVADGHKARGVCVTVRAAGDIDAGQEILHCYGPHSSRMATRARQRLLQEQYYFLCRCEACGSARQGRGTGGGRERSGTAGSGGEAGLLCRKCKGALRRNDSDKGAGFICSGSSCSRRVESCELSLRLQEIGVNLQTAVDLMERDRPDQALALLSRTQGEAAQVLAETHPLQGELDDAMARAYATMGDWGKAATHLERSAAAVGSQYGDDSAELGQQLFKLAQLHFNGGARGPALSVIPEVRRLLGLHSGPNSPELQELQAMEECLRL